LLSKKHNKVLEQATQSLRSSLSSSDVPLPDYVSSSYLISPVKSLIFIVKFIAVPLFSQNLTVLLETSNMQVKEWGLKCKGKSLNDYYQVVGENSTLIIVSNNWVKKETHSN
jgi:hypothetical protein